MMKKNGPGGCCCGPNCVIWDRVSNTNLRVQPSGSWTITNGNNFLGLADDTARIDMLNLDEPGLGFGSVSDCLMQFTLESDDNKGLVRLSTNADIFHPDADEDEGGYGVVISFERQSLFFTNSTNPEELYFAESDEIDIGQGPYFVEVHMKVGVQADIYINDSHVATITGDPGTLKLKVLSEVKGFPVYGCLGEQYPATDINFGQIHTYGPLEWFKNSDFHPLAPDLGFDTLSTTSSVRVNDVILKRADEPGVCEITHTTPEEPTQITITGAANTNLNGTYNHSEIVSKVLAESTLFPNAPFGGFFKIVLWSVSLGDYDGSILKRKTLQHVGGDIATAVGGIRVFAEIRMYYRDFSFNEFERRHHVAFYQLQAPREYVTPYQVVPDQIINDSPHRNPVNGNFGTQGGCLNSQWNSVYDLYENLFGSGATITLEA